ncbi:MAG: hypothetical protein ISR90_04255 [Candidatus Marinimicrobia bacterium]|nr:hypothetical protein [Candidatus Neomarinimicrobiota bacterium]MBL7023249.1 hypothetical protein [Candidatus Neomarinimicrobiota bacterium]MBL7108843.1 hypothetical protein [Candidatus Neomarinimicrobiota bacterium]
MKKIVYIILLVSFIYPQDFINPIMKSAILPGWGESALGETKRSQGYFLREGLIWLSFIGGQTIHKLYESDYTAFAILHAGTDPSSKDYQYAVDIGNYDSFEEYNFAKEQLRQGELIYPENINYEWKWDSKKNRLKFDDMRIISGTASKFVSFSIGGLIVHRLISVIDVLYLKRKNSPFRLESSLLPSGKEQVNLLISLKF